MRQVTFEVPDHLAASLQEAFGPDLARAAIESIAKDGYSSGKLSRYEAQQMLGMSNYWEFEEWRKRREVDMPYSLEDLEQDRETLKRVFGE